MTPQPQPVSALSPSRSLTRSTPPRFCWATKVDTLGEELTKAVRPKNFGSNLLLKRPKEVADVYQERYRRLTYEDILANCVRWYIAKLFATEAKIDAKTEDARFAAFLQDYDRHRHNLRYLRPQPVRMHDAVSSVSC